MILSRVIWQWNQSAERGAVVIKALGHLACCIYVLHRDCLCEILPALLGVKLLGAPDDLQFRSPSVSQAVASLPIKQHMKQ